MKQFIFNIFFLLVFNLNYSQTKKNNTTNQSIKKTRTLECQYCNRTFKQELKKVKYLYLTGWVEDEFWIGGFNHCDPNYSNTLEMPKREKYCSRKCACEAGED